MTSDELSYYYSDPIDGSYDCVDRIVLYGYLGLADSAGGFRRWWRRLHGGSDDVLAPDTDGGALQPSGSWLAENLKTMASIIDELCHQERES